MIDIESISTGLERGEDGIWYGRDARAVSYAADGHAACFAVEDRSFWFRHRNDCILSVVERFPPKDGSPIVDIGGGNGIVAAALAAAGFEVALLEPGRSGALNARRRGLETVICATTDSAGLKPGSLPAAGLFDVIEHVADDTAFLASIRELMQPRGRLYATVPAYPLLWSHEDVAAGHFRRYTRNGFCELLERGGFEVEFASGIFRWLPIPIALLRALPYRLGLARPDVTDRQLARDHVAPGAIITRLLEFLLGAEIGNLRRGRAMRFGASWLVVARRR